MLLSSGFMELIFSLLQQMCVYLVLAYLLSKTPLFLPLLNRSTQWHSQLLCYVVFSGFCILGTYLGLSINDAIANTRAIGAVLGGLFGGPLVGLAVGFTGGLHRYSLSGFTDLACAISTTTEGLLGGLVHLYLCRHQKLHKRFDPFFVFGLVFIAEILQMLLLLLIAKPFAQAYVLVSNIAMPMMLANAFGAACFVRILHDRKTLFEKYSAAYSRRALSIAKRSVGILSTGLTPNNAEKIARIIYEETNVGAVAITDRERILAFIGLGEDHHQANTPILSSDTLQAMQENRIRHLKGNHTPYQCRLSPQCRLNSALIIPLHVGETVVGSIKLYEPKNKLISTINLAMAEGIAQLLSSQLLHAHYLIQQHLLTQSEIKLLQAQVDPHFLFNALNTIAIITKRDPKQARRLLQHLAQFFRANLKRETPIVTLQEELDHVHAYLAIEQARFSDRLKLDIRIDPQYFSLLIPTFTLQPLVENAIKHGISQSVKGGVIEIYHQETANGVQFTVADNLGLYRTKPHHKGLGMEIVNKRLIHHFGDDAALKVEAVTHQFTKMHFMLPNTPPLFNELPHVNRPCH